MLEQIACRGVCAYHRRFINNKYSIDRAVFCKPDTALGAYAVAPYGVYASVYSIRRMSGKCAEYLGRTSRGSKQYCTSADSVESLDKRGTQRRFTCAGVSVEQKYGVGLSLSRAKAGQSRYDIDLLGRGFVGERLHDKRGKLKSVHNRPVFVMMS